MLEASEEGRHLEAAGPQRGEKRREADRIAGQVAGEDEVPPPVGAKALEVGAVDVDVERGVHAVLEARTRHRGGVIELRDLAPQIDLPYVGGAAGRLVRQDQV